MRTACLLSVVWLGLNGADLMSWLIGGPAIIIAVWTATRFPPARSFEVRWAGLLPFISYFVRQSILGGWDVARRVLGGRLDIAPGSVTFDTSLPPGPACHLLLNTISLLPGTLSAGIVGGRIDVHAIDTGTDHQSELRRLEGRIAGLVRCGDAPS